MSTQAPQPKQHHGLGEDIDHAGHVDTGIMSRRWIYIGSLVLLIGLLITGIVSFRNIHRTNEANNKANQLRDSLVAAGLPAPDHDTIVRLFGTDGGAVCEDPGQALRNGADRVGLGNGAAGPGQRPVIGPSVVVEAERIILQTYCPNKVADFDNEVDDLKFDDVAEQ